MKPEMKQNTDQQAGICFGRGNFGKGMLSFMYLIIFHNFYGRCPAGHGHHNVKISVCLCMSIYLSIFVIKQPL